jgi:hypothetical protein
MDERSNPVSDGINDGHAYTQGASISVTGKRPRRELAEAMTDSTKVPIAQDLTEKHERLIKLSRGSKAQQRYARFQLQLIERTSRAEAALEALQWTPITDRDIPDEPCEFAPKNFSFIEVSDAIPLQHLNSVYLIDEGFYWFRPLTPPRIEEKPNGES